MTRIPGADQVEPDVQRALDAQARKWGQPLANHRLYARRASIFRGARGMWAGLAESGLLDDRLHALLNRRVATINRCEF